MMPVTIEKQLTIAAKATTVWQFIGTEEGLRQWWGLDISFEAKSGGRCEERSHWQGRLCCWRGTVTAYQPPQQLSLFLRNADETTPWPAWVTISICLTESQGQTHVTLVQQAFDPMAVEPAFGQALTQPWTPTAPRVIWNRLPPQNARAMTPLNIDPFPLTTTSVASFSTNTWLLQQEMEWQARLQRLAQQVLLAPTVDEG